MSAPAARLGELAHLQNVFAEVGEASSLGHGQALVGVAVEGGGDLHCTAPQDVELGHHASSTQHHLYINSMQSASILQGLILCCAPAHA